MIPREHSRDLREIGAEDLAACASAAQRLAGRVRSRLDADGVNLLNACGAAAWQTVFHFHIHVIPRYATIRCGCRGYPDPGTSTRSPPPARCCARTTEGAEDMPIAQRGHHWLAYRDIGDPDGEPLLLIMGLGGSGRMWWRLEPQLAAEHRTILFDNRGTGDSDGVGGRMSMGGPRR